VDHTSAAVTAANEVQFAAKNLAMQAH